MERMTTRLRALIRGPGLIVAPACFDPFTARLVARAGFPCAALGGFVLGAESAISEPLLTMTEVVEAARRITGVIDIPLVVDAGAGYGEPLHTMRTVRELERAGVAACHIEDQVFPKRAHYHRDYREHIIPAEEMAAKIRFACQARSDSDFVVIARTDAMKTHGYAEGIRRTRLYAEAGADLVMLFPNDADEARRAPRDSPIPLVYVNSVGNRVGRPIFTTKELEDLGYKIAYEAISLVVVTYRAVETALSRLKEIGTVGLEAAEAQSARTAIESLIGLDDHYRVEEQTVERSGGPS
jgi:methylisocitrate lyase